MKLSGTEPSYWVWIYVAGDLEEVKRICQKYCEIGLCVTVEKVEFIYTGGREYGVRVGLINYPKFPSSREHIYSLAVDLAKLLREELYQDSVLIMDEDKTEWFTRR
jgi:hypothetical protein